MTQICVYNGVYLCHYIENLKSFLAEQAPCFAYDDANSVLEMLYYYYTEANPVDNAVIRCQFKELDGVQVGMRLFTELQQT